MILGLLVYAVLFSLVVLGLGALRRRKRRERPPVEFKLLRGPGESLRREMAKLDEAFPFQILGAALVPLLISYGVLWLLVKICPQMSLLMALLIIGISLIVCVCLSAIWMLKKLIKWQNYELGYLGERAVGESLESLLSEGYRVFHDVPASTGDRKFNLDHVVIGPTGLFLIETKTRRKGRARPGFKDHEVTYDGAQLIWPWVEDRHGLKQAQHEAEWLTKWIHKLTGLSIAAKPMLALPGWYVKNTTRGPVNVQNSKNLGIAIKSYGQVELTAEQIDLIARQFDAICRDVED